MTSQTEEEEGKAFKKEKEQEKKPINEAEDKDNAKLN